MSEFVDGYRLSAELWKDGRFPSMDDYRSILRRGRLLYSLDVGSFGPVGPEVADRPANLLYAGCGKGFTRDVGVTLGTGPNEDLLPFVDEYRDYTRSIHEAGVAVLVYQNDCNFAEPFFEPQESPKMDAELDPFSWAFGTPGRRFSCLNKPGWRHYLLERLKIRIGGYGADGVFLDNNTPFIHCGCEHCRKLYADWCGGDLLDDMGKQDTIVADMRVLDYVGAMQVPKNLPRLDDPNRLRYYEWRVLQSIDFYRTMRRGLEEHTGRPVVFTANGHIAIPEQAGVQLGDVFDMHFSEDGYTAPPVSNKFNIRLGTAMGQGIRSEYTLTRTTESLPVTDMVSVLAAEGRANGGSGEFWDMSLRQDERLLEPVTTMRRFFVAHADDVFAVERDINDTAILFSWRSDLWTSQTVSPSRHASDLMEDIVQSYDLLMAERDEDKALLAGHRLLIVPHVEILSDAWFEAIQKFLDDGGRVVSTGNVAEFDGNLSARDRRWSGDGWVHFTDRVDKQYSNGRKMLDCHTLFEPAKGSWVAAVDDALGEPSVKIEKIIPLMSINHTQLADGEAVHVVNRYVNVFPTVYTTPREGVVFHVRPRKEASSVTWLTPDGPDVELQAERTDGSLRIALPTLRVYGIIRLRYRDNS
jgi:hypothetical protein